MDTASGRLADHTSKQAVSVPATTLSKLLEEAPRGDFALVCDIEGAEYDVFDREPAAVAERCRLAVMELHDVSRAGRQFDPNQLGDWLATKWGMKIIFSDGKVWVLGR